MIKKTFENLFVESNYPDAIKHWWQKNTSSMRKKLEVVDVDDMLKSDTQPDNALMELEQKMGKSNFTFQQIISNSL
jgi:hypothetical protein